MLDRRRLLSGLASLCFGICVTAYRAGAEPSTLNEDEFWALVDLIEGSKWDDSTSDVTALIAALAELPPEKIEAFYQMLGDKALGLATQDHYAAFSSFPGLADTFLYARLAVIANGRQTYESILANAHQFPARSTNIWFERLLYVCDDAYRIAAGRDFPRPGSEKLEVMFR
jgi:hypothetical protein